MENETVAILGLNAVALAYALKLGKKGWDVLCLDSNQKFIKSLTSKDVLFTEPKLNELLKNSKNITFSTNYAELKNYKLICQTKNYIDLYILNTLQI